MSKDDAKEVKSIEYNEYHEKVSELTSQFITTCPKENMYPAFRKFQKDFFKLQEKYNYSAEPEEEIAFNFDIQLKSQQELI